MRKQEPLALLTLGALGVVYGDIGTSPLYAMNEVFFGSTDISLAIEHSVGVASLIFWLLVLVVGVKYVMLVLCADHHHEGGVFALMSLLQYTQARRFPYIALLLMFSAGLLFGEGIITPAISVLSAVEGLKVLIPDLSNMVIPLTLVILTGIFALQSRGARTMGALYGPVMLVWFVAIGSLGIYHLFDTPAVMLGIIDPRSAVYLLLSLEIHQLALLMGAVFLVLTGSEALFADLGHFGKRAIRLGWVLVVFPALVLCYAGQAAYLMTGVPIHADNLFYSMVPTPLLLPMIILATLATSIASVSLIFGAYSVVSQAVVLNLLPRMRVIHTNEHTEGQIYIPAVNWILYVGAITLVLSFGSASALASAYGFAVSGVMLVTTIALYEIARNSWGWSRTIAGGVFGFFALLDAGFVFANSLKFFEGGYIPLVLGCGIFAIILTWRWGRRIVRVAYDAYSASRDMAWFLDFKKRLEDDDGALCDSGRRCAVSLERTVVFLVSRMITHSSDRVPVKLRIYLKRCGAVPKHMVLLHINQRHVPYVYERYTIIDLGQGVLSVRATFGFMENPDASNVLRELYERKLFPQGYTRCAIETSEDEIIVDTSMSGLSFVRAHFFKLLLALSTPRYRYFGLVGEMATGLSKIVIPVRVSVNGVRIEIPEFALVEAENNVDPDTHLPTAVSFTAIT